MRLWRSPPLGMVPVHDGSVVGHDRGVLHEVRALVLKVVAHAQEADQPQRKQDEEAPRCGPQHDDERADDLHAELVAAEEGPVAADALRR
eukprot:CAMPEP_0176257342 /NCGR_PEP_ID=MMETSP0121_2-20121125/38000_1 /TAXON_ID=160619 /ORGANISM="Kryptoperidinium foliaceum, Strain CCMP 1326" /LENGTH=89 /DNA_ID=CAMNT_0017597183 /DNA_START=99 /DNA_END=364 /DNA_ORIENTATION=+